VRAELERVEIPGEHEARERTWAVAAASFAERQPHDRRRRMWRPALAIAIVVAAAAAVLSPPGRAVLDGLREVVGVERAQPALFSLPSGGRLLVASDAGVWVVQRDGSKRLLGPYREASWSPFGRFIVAAKTNELAALEPDGDVRWTLARPDPRSAVWTGSETDTRIAYVDRSGARVVAGDGEADHLLAAGVRGPLAWSPGPSHLLAYVVRGRIRVQDVDTRRVVWQDRVADGGSPVRALAWSSDGTRLAVLQPFALRVYGEAGQVLDQDDPSDATQDGDASFRPKKRVLSVIRLHGAQSTVFGLRAGAPRFSGTGVFAQLQWSPNGRWLLLTWPTADQWVFVHANGGKRRIRAVANVSEQFRSRAFPRVEGWCCTR
jgi:hypothetical protein